MIDLDHPAKGAAGWPPDGHPEAIDGVYREFRPRLIRFCRRRCSDAASAEDVVQETFSRAMRYVSSFDPSYPVWPWLKAIAQNVMAKDARKARRMDVAEPPALSIVDPMSRIDDRHELASALDRLSPRQQRAIRLRYLQDLSPREGALRMGLSVTAFNQILFRARDRLRQEYRRIWESALGVAYLPLLGIRRLRQWLGIQARRGRSAGAAGPADNFGQLAQIAVASVALVILIGASGSREAVGRPTSPTRPAILDPAEESAWRADRVRETEMRWGRDRSVVGDQAADATVSQDAPGPGATDQDAGGSSGSAESGPANGELGSGVLPVDPPDVPEVPEPNPPRGNANTPEPVICISGNCDVLPPIVDVNPPPVDPVDPPEPPEPLPDPPSGGPSIVLPV